MKQLIKIALWSIAALMTLLTMGLGAIMFWLYLLEIDNAAPGSFDYIVGIPDYAKTVPLLKPCAPPLYSYRAIDGNTGEYAYIDFGTSAPLNETLAYYRSFMERNGCTFYINEKGNTLGTRGDCKVQDIRNFSVTQYASDNGCFPVSIDLEGKQ